MCVVGIAERIAIPVVRDRSPKATTRCAVRLARRSGAGIEFVAASTPDGRDRAEALLRRRCDEATTSGAPATWRLLDAGDLDSYLSWSGAWCQCLGSSHRPRPATIPMLVVGRTCRAPSGDFRRVVAGVDSTPGEAEHIAAVGASLADRIGAELMLIEVVGAGAPSIDVPPSAHVSHVAAALDGPSRLFDTVQAGRPADGLLRLLDPSTIVVVGAGGSGSGVAVRLVRRAPCPVLVVPAGHSSLNVLHCCGSAVS